MNIGYCTNVHAGVDLETTQRNLNQHARAVRDRFAPSSTMGIGLWLSAATARSLSRDQDLDQFAEWLHEARLLPFTLNGFPYGDFHEQVVKHKVYLPTWAEPERLNYTLDLIRILDRLLPPQAIGSISTLPLMWGTPTPSSNEMLSCARQLVQVAQHLQGLEEQTGRLIHLCIEPEPGCVIQTSQDVVQLFEEHLRPLASPSLHLTRYLRICHDVCHAAVMFEDQAEVIDRYRNAGLSIGKVQVSSAIRIPWHNFTVAESEIAATELRRFAEDRYLHQTVVKQTDGSTSFYEDLPLAFASHANDRGHEWRVHYHVPIYLEEFGYLRSTQAEIHGCLAALHQHADEHEDPTTSVAHFEVETYAWNVLPKSLQQESLATGIATELQWFRDTISTSRES